MKTLFNLIEAAMQERERWYMNLQGETGIDVGIYITWLMMVSIAFAM